MKDPANVDCGSGVHAQPVRDHRARRRRSIRSCSRRIVRAWPFRSITLPKLEAHRRGSSEERRDVPIGKSRLPVRITVSPPSVKSLPPDAVTEARVRPGTSFHMAWLKEPKDGKKSESPSAGPPSSQLARDRPEGVHDAEPALRTIPRLGCQHDVVAVPARVVDPERRVPDGKTAPFGIPQTSPRPRPPRRCRSARMVADRRRIPGKAHLERRARERHRPERAICVWLFCPGLREIRKGRCRPAREFPVVSTSLGRASRWSTSPPPPSRLPRGCRSRRP